MNGQREIIEIPARVDRAEERPEKLRVAAYCRVSTSQEAQQNSYQAQRAYYLDIIESNPNWILADIFADDGDIFEPSQKVLTEQAVFLIWSNFLPFWANIHGGAEWATFFLPVILRADAEKPPLY